MNEPNQKVLEAEKIAKDQEIAALEKQIEAMGLRIAALSDTAEEKRTEARVAYRSKHAKRFADVDVSRALAGFPTQHRLTMANVTYILRVPNGEHLRQVQSFVQDPIVKAGDKTTDLSPIAPSEQRVLAWLTGIAAVAPGAPEQVRDLATGPVAARLTILRALPAVTVEALARECENLEAFLSISLELELGNFSPTP